MCLLVYTTSQQARLKLLCKKVRELPDFSGESNE